MPSFKDHTGQKYGKLTCVSYLGKSRWLCKCDCGGESTVRSADLTTGNTKSCGCNHEHHGLTHTPEFRVWVGILRRCYDLRSEDFKNYGERGILVCDRWRYSFSNFYADMGQRPTPQHSIDRIDNNLGYSPENCQWSTRKEQGRNRRVNHFITHNGETLCLQDWANRIGIGHTSLLQRIKRHGYEWALSTPRLGSDRQPV